MKFFKLYIGHNNKTKKRFSELEIKRLVSNFFNGFTLIKSEGCYKLTSEESYIIELITDDVKRVKELKSNLMNVLNQESIILTRTNLNDIEF